MDTNKACLIITACINPNKDVPVLSIRDNAERKKQYIDSIEYYIKNTELKYIIFCDNSNEMPSEDLVKLAKEYGKQFEWLSFKGNHEKVIEKGKGFGEAEIINYVISHSSLINKCDCFFKVTGRLIIKNIAWFIKLGKNSTNYFLVRSNNFVDTRCYNIKLEDYTKYFLDAGEYVDDRNDVFLEHVFYRIISKNNIKYKLFPIEPEFSGVSGSHGYSYDAPHYKNVIKSIIAFVMHR